MKAKKSLGQNFLKSDSVLEKIIEAGEISKNDLILEIGPGKGALTEKLLEKAKYVIAIEKDKLLFDLLKSKFENEIRKNKLILIEGDILKCDTKKIIGSNKYKIIANIPYNITGAILKKFLTDKHQPTDMVLMVQHEVGKRVVGKIQGNGRITEKDSLLSISVKAYGDPKIIMKVEARYFSPKPKVDSVVLKISNISRKIFKENNINEEKFWKIVHAGFAHKRKKLSGNLNGVISSKKPFFENYKDKRAEDLSLSDWIAVTKE